MKKILIILLAVLLLTGCAGEKTREKAEGNVTLLSGLSTTDLEGNAVDDSLYADNTLTMINIWSTTCVYCIREMPDLARLNADYADRGVRVVGLLADALASDGGIDEEIAAEGRDIVAEAGGDYTHILPNIDLYGKLLAGIPGYPATLFVDSEGNQVGEGLLGARDYDGWAQVIEEHLAALE